MNPVSVLDQASLSFTSILLWFFISLKEMFICYKQINFIQQESKSYVGEWNFIHQESKIYVGVYAV